MGVPVIELRHTGLMVPQPELSITAIEDREVEGLEFTAIRLARGGREVGDLWLSGASIGARADDVRDDPWAWFDGAVRDGEPIPREIFAMLLIDEYHYKTLIARAGELGHMAVRVIDDERRPVAMWHEEAPTGPEPHPPASRILESEAGLAEHDVSACVRQFWDGERWSPLSLARGHGANEELGIAALFDARELECLVRAAVELRNGCDPDDLSEFQLEVLGRAGAAVAAEDDAREEHILWAPARRAGLGISNRPF